MDDLISRKAALELLGEPHPLDHNAIADVQKIIALPPVPAVPLDALCDWLALNSLSIPCECCPYYENGHCTVIMEPINPCPDSADDWRQVITKWMEEQNATR